MPRASAHLPPTSALGRYLGRVSFVLLGAYQDLKRGEERRQINHLLTCAGGRATLTSLREGRRPVAACLRDSTCRTDENHPNP